MEITLNKINATDAKLLVKLNESDYKDNVEKKLKEYSKKASIKGFRPGKVPVGMIKKMYGTSILVDEVNHILGHKVKDYIKDNDVQIIGEPLPVREDADHINWEEQKDFEFTYEVGLIPPFDLDPKKLKVEKYTIKPEKKIVDDTVDNIRNQNGTTEKVEHVKEGDFVSGTLKQVGSDFETMAMIPTKQLKKETKAFIGAKVGDTITFDLQKAFDKDAAAVSHVTGVEKSKAGEMKGKFTLDVTEITRTAPAEVNQELFDKVFGKDTVKTEKEFKDKILETIIDNYERESQSLLGRFIVDEFIDKAKLDLSKDFLQKWIKATNENISDQELENNLDSYMRDLRWTIIRGKFVERDNITVDNDEVVGAARAKLLSQLNMPSISPELEEQFNQFAENYLKENNGRNYMNEYENILSYKVLENLKKEVSIKEKAVSVDKFNEMVNKLNG